MLWAGYLDRSCRAASLQHLLITEELPIAVEKCKETIWLEREGQADTRGRNWCFEFWERVRACVGLVSKGNGNEW